MELRARNLLSETGLTALLGRVGLKKPLISAWRYARHPRLVRHQLDVDTDYWSFRRKFGFLAQGHDLADPGKRVMVVSLSNSIAQVKLEAMLAKALQLRGYTPVIVTNTVHKNALRYFRAFGYDRFEFYDELCKEMPREAVEDGPNALEQSPTFRSLLGLEYRDVHVGRHVLSWIVRQLRHGSVEFSDPQVQQMLKDLLPRAVRSVRAAECLLDRVKPEVALFLEKGYFPFGEVFDVAVNRGVNSIQWPHSHRSDAFALKRYTAENRYMHPFSLSAQTWETVRQMPWSPGLENELVQELRGRYEEGTWFNRKFLQVGKRLKSPAEVRRQLGLDPSKKTAVIFSHVLWDATFFFGQSLFDDYQEWLVETVRAACENTSVNWVIKLHPDYVWKMQQLRDNAGPRDLVALSAHIGKLPQHIRVMAPETDISTHSLFEVTDYCLTVRGTIGIEMPCFGVPVFTAGTGRYSGLGFTVDSSSREEYLARVRHIQDYPKLTAEQTLLAKKHAYALFILRPCQFKTFEMVQAPMKKLGHPLDYNVVIRARSFQEMARAEDLEAFARWSVDSEEEDFLSPLADAKAG